MTRLYCKNFNKIARPLLCLTSDVKWQQGAFKQLSLDFLEEKCFIIVKLHIINPRLGVQMYIDTSSYAIRCYITQIQYPQGKFISYKIEVLIRYNFILLKGAKRNYGTYKRELLRIITFACKYQQLLISKEEFVILTDYKPLTLFKNSYLIQGIYAR